MLGNDTIEKQGRRTIYVDPPFGDEPEAPKTRTRVRRQPDRWRFRFPRVKTAVSAPTYNGELLIVNRTDRTWLLWHNYHNLGLLDAGDERSVKLVRAGTISARQLIDDPSAEYLLLSLGPDLVGVEIVDLAEGEGYYALRAIESAGATLESMPGSVSTEELGLSARTVNALQRIGVTSAGQLRDADLGELWDVRNGKAAYAELVEKFLLHGRNRGA